MYLKGVKNKAAEMSLFSVITLMWNLRVFLTDQMYFNRLFYLSILGVFVCGITNGSIPPAPALSSLSHMTSVLL